MKLKIPVFSQFFHYYFIFHRFIGHRTLLLGLFSFVITLTEGLGITIFVTYLQNMIAKNEMASGFIHRLENALTFAGIPATPLCIFFMIALVFFVRGILVLLFNRYQFSLLIELSNRISSELTRVFSSMNYRSYLSRNTGYFTNLITKEVNNTGTAYYQIAAQLPKTISVLTYMLLALRLNWQFTMVTIVFGAVIAVVFSSVSKGTRKYSVLLSDAHERLAGLTVQMLQAFKYVFATSSQQNLRERVDKSAQDVARYGSHIGLLSAVIPASSEPLIVTFLAFAVYYQGIVRHGDLSSLFVVMMFLYRVMRETTVIQSSWQTFNGYVGGVDKVVEAIDQLSAPAEKTGGVQLGKIERGFRLDHVSFRYQERDVLKDVTIDIPAKSMIGLVGESGSGKSTLVDLVTGILQPNTGTVSVDGKNYQELDLAAFRKKIGYVTQESVIFEATVANNVSLWQAESNPSLEPKVWAALKAANCASFVGELPLKLEQSVGERGLRLSGGQRQRLSIARELFKDPELLILDEATSALDSESEKLIQESIDSLKGKATALVIAHRLSTIRNCDRIYVLKDGLVVESGSFTELLQKDGPFRRMCELQSLA